MPGEDPALERVALLADHGADIERIVGLDLVDRPLQLPAVDELDVAYGDGGGLPRVRVGDASARAASTAGVLGMQTSAADLSTVRVTSATPTGAACT